MKTALHSISYSGLIPGQYALSLHPFIDKAADLGFDGVMLAGKRILVTGVVTRESIAYAVAERAQRHGAEIVLTGFGRGLSLTRRVAQRLPQGAEVLELEGWDPVSLSMPDYLKEHQLRLVRDNEAQ